MGTPEERLNSLLQGELSAVETYDMALEKDHHACYEQKFLLNAVTVMPIALKS